MVPDATTSAQDLTAVVQPDPGSGTIEFTFDGADVGGLAVSEPGGAVVVAFDMLPGTHQIEAAFSGNDADAPSSVTQTVTITQSPSSLWVKTPVQVGTSDEFGLSAVLTDLAGPVSGETVWFSAPGVPLCSAVTDSTGQATCFVNAGDVGPIDIVDQGVSASFGGDANHLPVMAHSPTTTVAPAAVQEADEMLSLGHRGAAPITFADWGVWTPGAMGSAAIFLAAWRRARRRRPVAAHR
jgi:hypothetical protein